MIFQPMTRLPDFAIFETEQTGYDRFYVQPIASDGTAVQDDMTIRTELCGDLVRISLCAQKTPVCRIRVRWNFPFPKGVRLLADAWERGYGDLEWRGLCAERVMPWYFLANRGEDTIGIGVKVRPSSMAFWQADENGVTLFMDVRSGGMGVHLNGRELCCAEVAAREYAACSAFQAAKQFCSVLCTDPILPKEPVYGSNNWYYAYGFSSHEEILHDVDVLCEMIDEKEPNRPFMVIDDGWQALHDSNTCNGGPWDRGNAGFPDMPGLARQIKEHGCKPGIWVRLLRTHDESLPDSWRLPGGHEHLDPSVPEVLDYVRESVSRIQGWGYQLLKHDFSTYDIFGKWGPEMGEELTNPGWTFADNTKTTAEIILQLYRTIYEASNGMYILGCNCIGHLGAGLMHLQRIGDDTSGVHWERTRRVGVNTLAFRLAQNKAFFDVDADCVGVMGTIPWEKNRQWSKLVAMSGTSLFVSAKPGVMTEEEKREMAEYFSINAKQADTCEPLDWLDTRCPSEWLINGEKVTFDWYEESGLMGFTPLIGTGVPVEVY